MVESFSFSEAGGHPDNEDAYRVQTHPQDTDCWLCFIADGQGGRAGGGPAAQLACQAALDAALSLSSKSLMRPMAWPALLQHADAAVEQDSIAGYTTLIALCICGRNIVGASCGDSAVLLVTGNTTVELTRGQLKNPPVGSGMAEPIPFAARVDIPWSLVAMTDGVWKYVGWERVREIAADRHGSAMIQALAEAAKLPRTGQFQDDFTVVLIEHQQ